MSLPYPAPGYSSTSVPASHNFLIFSDLDVSIYTRLWTFSNRIFLHISNPSRQGRRISRMIRSNFSLTAFRRPSFPSKDWLISRSMSFRWMDIRSEISLSYSMISTLLTTIELKNTKLYATVKYKSIRRGPDIRKGWTAVWWEHQRFIPGLDDVRKILKIYEYG